MTSTIEPDTQLDALREYYSFQVNALIEEGREDLVTGMSDQYDRDAAELTQGAA